MVSALDRENVTSFLAGSARWVDGHKIYVSDGVS
jgi:hypothetical protein